MNGQTHNIRMRHLAPRRVCVIAHHGSVETIDDTRRPLYQHMIAHELVHGPSIIRFLDPPKDDHLVDAIVVTHREFAGDHVCTVDELEEGTYAMLDYEGPPDGLVAARRRLTDWVKTEGHTPGGALLQVHMMDEIEGIVEQQLQMRLQDV